MFQKTHALTANRCPLSLRISTNREKATTATQAIPEIAAGMARSIQYTPDLDLPIVKDFILFSQTYPLLMCNWIHILRLGPAVARPEASEAPVLMTPAASLPGAPSDTRAGTVTAEKVKGPKM